MKTRSAFVALGVGVLCFLIGYNFGLLKTASMQTWKGPYVLERDTVRVCDTVIEPVPVRVATVRHDTIYTPKDTVYLPIERKEYSQSIDTDSVRGTIRATLTGYDARLDSLVYDLRIERQIIIAKERKRWGWNITAGPGLGWDFRRHAIAPMAGITIGFGYNF